MNKMSQFEVLQKKKWKKSKLHKSAKGLHSIAFFTFM